MTDVVTIRLLGVPPAALLDLLAALDALHREVQVATLGEVEVVEDEFLHGLVDDRARLEAQRHGLHDQAVAARDAGSEHADLVVTYRAEEVSRVRSATAALGAANQAAVEGTLLIPPLTPVQHRLWSFLSAQFEAQLGGAEPVPYSEAEAAGAGS